MQKRRFIAGARCTQCDALDRIVQVTSAEDEWIECVDCGYRESRPTDVMAIKSVVTNSPSNADEVGVVQFKPLR